MEGIKIKLKLMHRLQKYIEIKFKLYFQPPAQFDCIWIRLLLFKIL